MELLLGKPLSLHLLTELREKILHSSVKPGLAVLLIGEDPASKLYVGLKEKAAEKIGVYFERHFFPATEKEETILEKIKELNRNPSLHGILVQLPLPTRFNENRIIQAILPEKDADGFHPTTLERYFRGEKNAQPVFPRAVARLILSPGENIQGKKAVALVNSELFGKVMQKTLEDLGLSVSLIYRQEWEEKKSLLSRAKVVVTAWGEPEIVQGTLLSPGTIIIDGGITRVGEKVLGDVASQDLDRLSGWRAPVPGGVGPLTVASLLERVTELTLRVPR